MEQEPEPAPEPSSEVGTQTDHLPIPWDLSPLSLRGGLHSDLKVYVIWTTPLSPWGDRAYAGVHLAVPGLDPWLCVLSLLAEQTYVSGRDRLVRVRAVSGENILDTAVATFRREARTHSIFDTRRVPVWIWEDRSLVYRNIGLSGLSQSSTSSPVRSTRQRREGHSSQNSPHGPQL
eukprot:6486040-Amphidinium_carterae.1